MFTSAELHVNGSLAWKDSGEETATIAVFALAGKGRAITRKGILHNPFFRGVSIPTHMGSSSMAKDARCTLRQHSSPIGKRGIHED